MLPRVPAPHRAHAEKLHNFQAGSSAPLGPLSTPMSTTVVCEKRDAHVGKRLAAMAHAVWCVRSSRWCIIRQHECLCQSGHKSGTRPKYTPFCFHLLPLFLSTAEGKSANLSHRRSRTPLKQRHKLMSVASGSPSPFIGHSRIKHPIVCHPSSVHTTITLLPCHVSAVFVLLAQRIEISRV